MLTGFYTANWEEYHTEVLRTTMYGMGLTECQLMLIFFLFIQGVSGGTFSMLRMRDIGMVIMPNVDEQHV